jgi:hypothetical protein
VPSSGIAAGHHRQRAFLGALGAAGDRRVDPAHAVRFLQPCRDRARRIGMDRGEVDHELCGAAGGCNSVGAEHDMLHSRGIGETHEDDAGGRGDIARRAGRRRTCFDQPGGFAG